MRKLILIIISFWTLSSYAQITITGRLLDYKGNWPLTKIFVAVDTALNINNHNINNLVQSNDSGYFQIKSEIL